MGRYLSIYETPFEILSRAAIGAPTKWAKNVKFFEKMAKLNGSENFFSKSAHMICPLYGNRGLGSRFSGSGVLKMLRKNFCNTSNGKNDHFVYILKNRLFFLE